jgi:hypothetical protein
MTAIFIVFSRSITLAVNPSAHQDRNQFGGSRIMLARASCTFPPRTFPGLWKATIVPAQTLPADRKRTSPKNQYDNCSGHEGHPIISLKDQRITRLVSP